ncbi:MAG: SO_0444 family Cu/Zn efflux transporter [Phycisphaerae bacterium]|nr:SO_0444 family Cu/Zn efflux transporter [Phycisphaerae bacterium]
MASVRRVVVECPMWFVVNEVIRILNESAAYLLLGFALAGVLYWLINRSPRFSQALATRGSKSVFLAALFGLPLPLCSCSVLPAGMALRKQGASKGATVSFLISVPETDIVSILITYGLLGPVMAIFRPFAALVTAIVTGLVVNLVDGRAAPPAESDATDSDQAGGQQCESCAPQSPGIWDSLRYGFVTFFDDIIGLLLFGIILGGIITALLPVSDLERFAGGSLVSMLIMLAVGIPLYVCATSSTPIAVGLIAAGVSPGAALVFLLVGPATNTASLVVLAKHLGRSALVAYLCSIAVISVLMGLWLDTLIASPSVDMAAYLPSATESSWGLLKGGASALLVLLSILSFRRTGLLGSLVERAGRWTGVPISVRGAKIGAVVCVLLAYVGSGFFIVRPGQRAVVTRFGHITQSNLKPGLHYRWPYPIARTDIVSVTQVRRVELGFRLGANPGTPAAVAAYERMMRGESWVLTGHEDIIDIRWVVQYQVRDSAGGDELLKYLYGVESPGRLVRNTAEAAIRAAVGCRGIDTLLTTARAAVEDQILNELLQPALDRCNAGIRVLDVSLVDVHAPSEVHWAFRDVASAAEDKMKTINIAHEYQEQVVRQARGKAAERVLVAEGGAVDRVQRAKGEGAAFSEQWAAYLDGRVVTRLRLYFESMDVVLSKLTKYINGTKRSARGLDLWIIKGEGDSDQPALPQFGQLTGP